jgi:hypothetical protein
MLAIIALWGIETTALDFEEWNFRMTILAKQQLYEVHDWPIRAVSQPLITEEPFLDWLDLDHLTKTDYCH